MATLQSFSLTDIPGELGKDIMSQIRNSKRFNYDELNAKSNELLLKIIKEEKEDKLEGDEDE